MDIQKINRVENELSNIKLIAKGGQKSVFSAIHPIYGKIAFKKVEKLNDESKKRMEREASILKDLHAKAFPKIFDIIFAADNSECVILEEFIDGTTLRKVMPKYFSPQSALILLKKLTKNLTMVWEKNIVHRDLKPENILIDRFGEIKIIDFGCARALGETTITKEGGAPLTIRYAAPEQIQYNKNKISIRTDQFALGIITGELIYKGIHPFDFSLTGEQDMAYAIINNLWYRDGIKSYPHLTNLLERLLSIQPHSRFPNSKLMIQAIDLAIEEFHEI